MALRSSDGIMCILSVLMKHIGTDAYLQTTPFSTCSLHGLIDHSFAARTWDFQVIVQQYQQGEGVRCSFFSMESAAATPCTLASRFAKLYDGERYTGDKWYLPASPGDGACAPCPEGMTCDGVHFMIQATTTKGGVRCARCGFIM